MSHTRVECFLSSLNCLPYSRKLGNPQSDALSRLFKDGMEESLIVLALRYGIRVRTKRKHKYAHAVATFLLRSPPP